MGGPQQVGELQEERRRQPSELGGGQSNEEAEGSNPEDRVHTQPLITGLLLLERCQASRAWTCCLPRGGGTLLREEEMSGGAEVCPRAGLGATPPGATGASPLTRAQLSHSLPPRRRI